VVVGVVAAMAVAAAAIKVMVKAEVMPCLYMKYLLRCSGIACIVKGYHSFTGTPCISSTSAMIHTCLCLPSYSWYSFTDPEGMES